VATLGVVPPGTLVLPRDVGRGRRTSDIAPGVKKGGYGYSPVHPTYVNPPGRMSDVRCRLFASDVPLRNNPNGRPDLNEAADVRLTVVRVREQLPASVAPTLRSASRTLRAPPVRPRQRRAGPGGRRTRTPGEEPHRLLLREGRPWQTQRLSAGRNDDARGASTPA